MFEIRFFGGGEWDSEAGQVYIYPTQRGGIGWWEYAYTWVEALQAERVSS